MLKSMSHSHGQGSFSIPLFSLCVLLSVILWTVAGPLCPCDSSGKNTGVGCHFFLQGIFLTQELNPCLLQWQESSLPLAPTGKPQIFIFYIGV